MVEDIGFTGDGVGGGETADSDDSDSSAVEEDAPVANDPAGLGGGQAVDPASGDENTGTDSAGSDDDSDTGSTDGGSGGGRLTDSPVATDDPASAGSGGPAIDEASQDQSDTGDAVGASNGSAGNESSSGGGGSGGPGGGVGGGDSGTVARGGQPGDPQSGGNFAEDANRTRDASNLDPENFDSPEQYVETATEQQFADVDDSEIYATRSGDTVEPRFTREGARQAAASRIGVDPGQIDLADSGGDGYTVGDVRSELVEQREQLQMRADVGAALYGQAVDAAQIEAGERAERRTSTARSDLGRGALGEMLSTGSDRDAGESGGADAPDLYGTDLETLGEDAQTVQAPGQSSVTPIMERDQSNSGGDLDQADAAAAIDRILSGSRSATNIVQTGVFEPLASGTSTALGIGLDATTAQADLLAGRDLTDRTDAEETAVNASESVVSGFGEGITMLTVGAPQVAASGYDVAAGGAEYTADELSEGDPVDPIVAGGEFAADVAREEYEYATGNPARYTGQLAGGALVGGVAARGAAAAAPSSLTGGRLSATARAVADPIRTSFRAGRRGIQRFRNADNRGMADASLTTRSRTETESESATDVQTITADDLVDEQLTGPARQVDRPAGRPNEAADRPGYQRRRRDRQERTDEELTPYADDAYMRGSDDRSFPWQEEASTPEVGRFTATFGAAGGTGGALLAAAQSSEVGAATATRSGIDSALRTTGAADTELATGLDTGQRTMTLAEQGLSVGTDTTPRIGTTPTADVTPTSDVGATTRSASLTDMFTPTPTESAQTTPAPDPTPSPTPTPGARDSIEIEAPGADDGEEFAFAGERATGEIITEFVDPLTGERGGGSESQSGFPGIF